MQKELIKPFVSFCMATYKRGEILLETLQSIQRQTYVNFEVIISDNDIEESGKVWVEKLHDERFKYFVNSHNLGMKPSFNKSIERSSGEYIVMIADDDPVYFDMVETLIDLQRIYPEKGMYMGGCDWFCVHGETAEMYNMKVGTNSCLSNKLLFKEIKNFSADDFLIQFFSMKYFPHYLWSCCMVKKSIIQGFGGTPDYGTPFLGDYAYMSTMSSVNGAVVINKALGCQTLHKENFGRNQHDQLITVSTNLPQYFIPKIVHLAKHKEITKHFYHFLGMAMVSHIAFLQAYFKKQKVKVPELSEAEKNVFSLPYMKPFYKKYFIKKHFPLTHDIIVKVKKRFTNNHFN
jgi:glycosyltransferase involved in cell wall biosynthesis